MVIKAAADVLKRKRISQCEEYRSDYYSFVSARSFHETIHITRKCGTNLNEKVCNTVYKNSTRKR